MRITMLGLQSTGKTTYAVGAYAGMRSGKYSTMRLLRVTESVATLNAGLERLSRRLPVSRTDTGEAETIGLRVSTDDGREHDLRVPDRSGEALRGTLHSRRWDPALLEELRGAEGLILFLRPGEIKPGESVAELAALTPPLEDAEPEDEPEKPWSPPMMPTDVSLVDALQELQDAGEREEIPVAVVISAWDEVPAGLTPREWLRSRVPLLAQYLEAATDRLRTTVFAVSVQGGAFVEVDSEEEAERVEVEVDVSEPDPWDRATCIDADGAEAELVAPLVWVLGADG